MLRRIALAGMMALGALPAQAGQSNCADLRATLASLANGGTQSPLFEKYDAAVHRQQFELDRALRSARRYGCDGRGFMFRSEGHPACATILSQIDEMRDNLDMLERKRAKLATGKGSRIERAKIERALVRGGCTGKPKAKTVSASSEDMENPRESGQERKVTGITYRTLCVRQCDGYYWPVSFSTTPDRFDADEQTCSQRCPGAETSLFVHRNPGEDVEAMVSREGKPYSELANAFLYRDKIKASCGCGTPTGGLLEVLNSSGEDRSPVDEAASAAASEEPTRADDRATGGIKTEYLGDGEMRSSMGIPGMVGETGPKPAAEPAAEPESSEKKQPAGEDKTAKATADDKKAGTGEAAKDEAATSDPTKRKVRIVGPSYSYTR